MSDRFVGTWRLVPFVERGADGREASTFGPDPLGLLMYDKGARVSVQIARSDRTYGYFGYFGRYSVDERAGTVTHHVEGGSDPHFAGTEQRRLFIFNADRLVLSTPPERMGGSGVTYTAAWERLPT